MTNPYDDIKDERDRLSRRTKILAGQLEQRRAQHVATTDELREARARIAELEAETMGLASQLHIARNALSRVGVELRRELEGRPEKVRR